MVMRVFRNGSKNFKNSVALARQFSKDEDGGVFTIFVVLGFILILATTGIGVDMMHFERNRANLQAALDRAVLAAADLEQTLTPKEVVEAYFEKAGVKGNLLSDAISVEEGLGSRRVSAQAEVDTRTAFMFFYGYPVLTATAASTAEESVGAIEISMVLDMSGSMNRSSAEPGKTKIEVLRSAAKKFVDTMYEKENPDRISISIVPYATQVNAGENILDKFVNVTAEHDVSHCVNFTGNQFSQHALGPGTPLIRTAHFDRYTASPDSAQWELPRRPTCPTRDGSEITPVTNDIDDLHDQIDALTATGNTSIDIGMKWGAALVDPAMQPVIEQLSRQSADPGSTGGVGELEKTIVPKIFRDRPKDYGSDVQKIIIVMTDGQNTGQWQLRSDLRDGASNVSYTPGYTQVERRYNWDIGRWEDVRVFGEYSVLISTEPPEYWWTRQGVRSDHRFGEVPGEIDTSVDGDEIGPIVLTYPQLFSRTSLRWNALNNYRWFGDRSSRLDTYYTRTHSTIFSSTKNTRTQNICSAIKDENVKVYGIAFEAPSGGKTVIRNCSSGDGYYFEVNDQGNLGTNNQTLEQVFESIASSIKRLRLTQ